MYAQRHADTVIRKVSEAIQLARMSAIRTGKLVTLCRSDSGVEWGGQWQDGIMVFSDRNGDRKINQDDVLQQFITFPGINGSLKWRAFQNRQYYKLPIRVSPAIRMEISPTVPTMAMPASPISS